MLCAKLPRDSSSTKYPPWLSNSSCHRYSPKEDVESLGKLSHETGKKTPKSLVWFARLKPVTIFSQCKQFMKLMSLKENSSKISEVKQWHARSEREKRKEMSTFNYALFLWKRSKMWRKFSFWQVIGECLKCAWFCSYEIGEKGRQFWFQTILTRLGSIFVNGS